MTLSSTSPRLRQNFDLGWRFHLGDVGRLPRMSTKAAGLPGLTNQLGDEIPPVHHEDRIVAMFAKLAKVPGFSEAFGDPYPKDKETGWVDIRLPHDWKVDLPFTNDTKTCGPNLVTQGYKPSGVGCYRKLFDIPSDWEGKKISLEFDGIMGASTVYVNGVFLGEHWSGYTSFAYDVTDILNYGVEGPNVIFIRTDSADSQGWWYEGAGIYRHTWLVVTGPLRAAHWGVSITTPQVSREEALVVVETTVENGFSQPRSFEVKTTLVESRSGQVVGQAVTSNAVPGLEKMPVHQEIFISTPLLWSPDSPNLYHGVTEVICDGHVVDQVTTQFGVRSIDYTRDGLFINGQHTIIKGACVHQDFAGVGVALPDRIMEYRIQRLKECGCNAYRSAHNPATPELMDACDRVGMLVLDENRILESTEFGLAELESMILRDRNHPSVFAWSLSNEERVAASAKGRRLYRAMVDHSRKLDPTRPLTTATSGGKEDGDYIDIADIAGYNYVADTHQYGLARKHYEQYPNRRFMGTEDACHFTTRGIYEDDPSRAWCDSFTSAATLIGPRHPVEDVDLYEFLDVGALASPFRTWQHYLENPFMSGVFIWTGYDYRGEPFPWRWPQIMHQGGIYDMCGFEKDETYFYKAIWKDEPVVHIMPHWNWPNKVGQEMRVRVYTNCDQIELLVNSRSLGTRPLDDVAQVNWQVVYEPGVIEARGYKDGKQIASDRRETTGAPEALRITIDRPHICADGTDLALCTVEVIDSAGRVVPTASPELTFSLNGPAHLLGLGAGDPASHEPDHSDHQTAFNGLCLAIVQSAGEPGEAILNVASPGLMSGSVKIEME